MSSLLPTFHDVKSACAQLPQQMPEANLLGHLDLRRRPECIFVGARGCGKSTLAQQLLTHPVPVQAPRVIFNVYDDNEQHTYMEVARIAQAMLRSPVKPIILLRSTTWQRIKRLFSHVPPSKIAHIGFPRELFEAALPTGLVAGDGSYLHRWSMQFFDANGDFLPSCAWAATRYLGSDERCRSKTSAKNIAATRAGAEHLQFYYPELMPHMTFLVADAPKYRFNGARVHITEERIMARTLTAMRTIPLPYEFTRPEWMRWLEVCGVWRRDRTAKAYTFARSLGSGASYLKNQLTLHTLERSVNV